MQSVERPGQRMRFSGWGGSGKKRERVCGNRGGADRAALSGTSFEKEFGPRDGRDEI